MCSGGSFLPAAGRTALFFLSVLRRRPVFGGRSLRLALPRTAFRRSIMDGRVAVMSGGIPPVARRHSPVIGPMASGREGYPPYGVPVVSPGRKGMAVNAPPGVLPVPVPVIEEIKYE